MKIIVCRRSFRTIEYVSFVIKKKKAGKIIDIIDYYPNNHRIRCFSSVSRILEICFVLFFLIDMKILIDIAFPSHIEMLLSFGIICQ